MGHPPCHMFQNSCISVEASFFCDFAGAHLNAAITVTQCVLGNLSLKALIAYVIGQFLGSFLAAATVFGLYYGRVVSFITEVAVGIISDNPQCCQKYVLLQYPAWFLGEEGKLWVVGPELWLKLRAGPRHTSGKDMHILENTAPFTQGILTSKTCLQQKGSSCILSAFCFQVCTGFIYINYHVLGTQVCR